MTISHFSSRAGLVLAVLAALASGGSTAFAAQQVPVTPSQLPPGEAAVRPGPDARLSLPAVRGLQAPAGAAETTLIISEIAVEGGIETVTAQARAALPEPGARVSLEAVYAYAGLLQRLYFEAGYPLIRVVVPAQDIDPGGARLRILVINGFIDRVDVSALPPQLQRQVSRMLMPLVGNEAVSAEELERRVFLAGDTAGLTLRSLITPGEEIGGASLVLTGDYQPVSAVLSADNRLVETSGREQLTASLALNSLFARGDQFQLTAATALNDPRFGRSALRSYLGFSASVPVGVDGWSASVQLIHAASAPEPLTAAIGFDGEFFRVGLTTTYALRRSREASINVSLGFDASYEDQNINLAGLGVPLFADRTRVIRASVSGTHRLARGQFGYDAQLSRGLSVLGARSSGDASTLRPLSRDGADADFTRLTAGVTLTQNVFGPLRLVADLRGQTSFNEPLLRSEQGSIIGAGLISAPPGGLVTGDRMIAGRVELQAYRQFGDDLVVQPFVALSGGESHLERPTALERAHTAATGPSLGVRATLGRPGSNMLSGQLEWTRLDSNDARLARDWFGFSVALRY